MTTYRVIWEIDIEADNPQEAADKAWGIQHDPNSTASAFDVWEGERGVRIDLTLNGQWPIRESRR